jgi:hypothetical protein
MILVTVKIQGRISVYSLSVSFPPPVGYDTIFVGIRVVFLKMSGGGMEPVVQSQNSIVLVRKKYQ